MSTRTFLPYGRQHIAEEDIEAVVEALRGDFITQGPTIARFEEAVGEYTGAAHVVAFANGTAALHGAAFAAGIGQGDDAVTTPLSFSGSSNCVRYQGGMPRFVDISPDDVEPRHGGGRRCDRRAHEGRDPSQLRRAASRLRPAGERPRPGRGYRGRLLMRSAPSVTAGRSAAPGGAT